MNIQTVTGASPKTKKTSTWIPDAGRIVCVSCNLSSQLVSFTLITAFSTQLSLVKALQKSDAHGFNNPKATRSPGSQAKSGFLKIERSAANQLGLQLGHRHSKTSLAKTWGQVLVQIWGRFDESNSKVATFGIVGTVASSPTHIVAAAKSKASQTTPLPRGKSRTQHPENFTSLAPSSVQQQSYHMLQNTQELCCETSHVTNIHTLYTYIYIYE